MIGDEWFSWLRPISQFIVQMDEVLSAKEPVSPNQIHMLLEEVRGLVPPNQGEGEAATRYFQALQRDATVAGLHGEVSLLMGASAIDGDGATA